MHWVILLEKEEKKRWTEGKALWWLVWKGRYRRRNGISNIGCAIVESSYINL